MADIGLNHVDVVNRDKLRPVRLIAAASMRPKVKLSRPLLYHSELVGATVTSNGRPSAVFLSTCLCVLPVTRVPCGSSGAARQATAAIPEVVISSYLRGR